MLTIFFIIIFIAELIIFEKIISVIRNCTKSVQQINNQVEEIKPILTKHITSAKSGVGNITKGVFSVSKFLTRRKMQALIAITKGALALVLFLILKKMPNKKILTAVDLIYAITNIAKA